MSTPRRFVSPRDARAPFFVGVDLGGTSIKLGVVDDLGRPMSWLSLPTEAERGAEQGARRMGEGVLEAIRQAGLTPDQVARVGLGSPGTMDIPAGMLVNPHNLPGWINFPIRDAVSGSCGLPVSFANDAGAAAYGEYWVGTGRALDSIVLFTLGTGVGCGIIVRDFAIEGEHSHGAECGHMIIDHNADARLCSCGQLGHLEAYASGTAVIKRTREALDAGRPSSLSARIEAGDELTPLLLAEQAEAGDALSLEIVLDTARFVGVGAVNLMHTIDPNGVVIGGAMTFGGNETDLGRRFLTRIRDEVRRRAFPVLVERTTIDYAALGGDAGFIGAAGIARLEYRRQSSA